MKKFAIILFCAVLFAAQSFGASAKENIQLGMKAYAEGDYKLADSLLKKITQADDAPSYRLALFLRASIASSTGERSQAMDLYEQSFKNPPEGNFSELALSFAKFADSNEMYADCARLLPTLPGFSDSVLTSKDLVAWYYAKALLKTGETRKGLSVLGEMWDAFSESKSADSCDLLAISVADKDPLYKDFKLASLQLKSVRTLAAKGRAALINSALFPEVGEADISELSLGELFYLASEYKNKYAISALASRAAAEPDSIFAWRAMFIAAQNLFDGKNYEGALELLAQAESMAPDDLSLTYPVTLLKGDCYRLMRNYAAAREEYLKVVMSKFVKGEPSAEAVYKTGMTWYSEGDYPKAHAYFERVYVAFFPFDYWASRAYLYDAKSLIYLAKPNMAHKVLREYIRTTKNPSGPIYEEAFKLYWGKE